MFRKNKNAVFLGKLIGKININDNIKTSAFVSLKCKYNLPEMFMNSVLISLNKNITIYTKHKNKLKKKEDPLTYPLKHYKNM